MIEKCVFFDVNFQNPALPTYRGDCGECFAQAGEQMNNCCYSAAKWLILQGQKELVIETVQTLKGKSISKTSRVRGINGALIGHT